MESVPTTTDSREASHPDTAERAHGDRARYVKDRCRCEACTAANTRYQQTRRAQNSTPGYVDAGAARDHLDQLVVGGMGMRGIARASGLSRTTLHEIAGRRLERIAPDTERRILELRIIDPGEHPAELDEDVLACFEELARKLGQLDRSWVRRAACRRADVDAELFHVASTDNAPRALAICAACVVRHQCLDYALAAGESAGVWGGTTPPERRRLAAGRALAEQHEGAA